MMHAANIAIASAALTSAALRFGVALGMITDGFRPRALLLMNATAASLWIGAQLMTNGTVPWMFVPDAVRTEGRRPFCTVIDVWMQYTFGLSLMLVTVTHRFWDIHTLAVERHNAVNPDDNVKVITTDNRVVNSINFFCVRMIGSHKRLRGALIPLLVASSFAGATLIEFTDGSLAQYDGGEGCRTTPPVRAVIHLVIATEVILFMLVVWVVRVSAIVEDILQMGSVWRNAVFTFVLAIVGGAIDDMVPPSTPDAFSPGLMLVWMLSELCTWIIFGSVFWKPFYSPAAYPQTHTKEITIDNTSLTHTIDQHLTELSRNPLALKLFRQYVYDRVDKVPIPEAPDIVSLDATLVTYLQSNGIAVFDTLAVLEHIVPALAWELAIKIVNMYTHETCTAFMRSDDAAAFVRMADLTRDIRTHITVHGHVVPQHTQE